MKKVFSIVLNIIVYIFTFLAVGIMLFTIVSVNLFNNSKKDLFGYMFFIVQSDSMSATDFEAGDIVFSKAVDPSTLKEGDIISFVSQNSVSKGETVTHKIRKVTRDENGGLAFVTYGTTTNVDDEVVVSYPYVLGKYYGKVSKLGYFFQYLKSPRGYIFCIFVPFIFIILYYIFKCLFLYRKYKKEQLLESKLDNLKIELNRLKTKNMQKEIKQLKEQIAVNNAN